MLLRRVALEEWWAAVRAVDPTLSETPAANPSCALRSNATRRGAFRSGTQAAFCRRGRPGKTCRRANAEHFFPSGPRIRHGALQGAVNYELCHLFDDVPKIKFRDPVAFEIGSRIQKIDRVRHAFLDCELDCVHLVPERLIDCLCILHDPRTQIRRKIIVL